MPTLEIQDTLDIKHRPKIFEDVVGQNKIVTILQGMFKSGCIDRTIMLHGPSGSGKTTLARLIARYVNCTGDVRPCGKCLACTIPEIEDHPDVHELNMAHATGVDKVRELIGHAEYLPGTNFRIFILDEAHQMSSAATQCILKPLEKPPEHAIWILCTTEIQKFKDTILGRCTKLQIQPIKPIDLAKRLQKVAKLEKSPIWKDKKSLMKIASLVQGQPREGLKALGTVMHYLAGSGKVDTDMLSQLVQSVTGMPPDVLISKFLLSVYLGRFASAMTSLKESQNQEYFLKEAIRFHINVFRSQVKESLVDGYPPFLRLIEAVRKNNIKLPNSTMSNILRIMVSTYSEVKKYSIDVSFLLLAMTGDIVNEVQKC